jgi:two-component system, cell cycle sensor histidine kinase DivJ
VLSSRGVFAAAQVLVHPSVAAPDRERHTAFVTHMLGLAFAALGIAPFFLALHGAPTLAESLLFALTLVPVSAAMIVARSGRLELGHLTASLGFTLVALVLCLVLHAGPGLSAAWLAVAMVEAAASLDVKVMRRCMVAIVVALTVILAMSLSAGVAAALPAVATAVIAGLAIFVAALRLERLVADVTSQRAAMTRSFNRTRALEAAFGRAVVGFDATGSVCAVTAPRGNVLDTLEAEVVGRGLFDRVQVADRPAFQKLIDDAARTDATLVGTFRLRGPRVDGEEPGFRSVEVRAHRVVAGGEESVVAVLDDVTSRAGQDEAVESAARAMAEALHAKDMFLTTMTHELRTPLNAIIGFSDILASRTTRPDDVAKQREFARIINQSGQSLLAIVNAVLDMSRIRVGSYPIVAEPFDPAALLAQAIDAVSAAARDGGVRLARDVPAKLEEVVGDRRALRQAVVAVLSNAIKNTPERGTVTLGARPCGTALAITVADTGYGIAAKDLKHIGEPFFQAAGAGRGVGGSGLGLALVRGLLGLHGGTLSVESEAGGGTVVTLRIPLDCTTAPSTADAPIEIVPPRHRRTSPQLKDVA